MAIHHVQTALGIAPPNWHEELIRAHQYPAELFRDEDEFDDANFHIEQVVFDISNPVGVGRKLVRLVSTSGGWFVAALR